MPTPTQAKFLAQGSRWQRNSKSKSTYVSNWKRALERFSTPQALTKSKLRGRAEARGMVSEAWVAMLMEFGETQVTGEGRKPREPAEKVLVGDGAGQGSR